VEDQVLPLRSAGGDGGPSAEISENQLDDVPELGLSEDVFAGAEVSVDDQRGENGAAEAEATEPEPEASADPEPEASPEPEPEPEAEPEAEAAAPAEEQPPADE
jgi:small subunit ribosomal protein S1